MTSIKISLRDALRDGAIVRGTDLSEEEVQVGEKLAPEIRRDIARSGDHNLMVLISKLPDESHSRLISILNGYR